MRLPPTDITGPDIGPEDLPHHFARFIGRLSSTEDPAIHLAAALVSNRQQEGHVCIDLAEVAGTPSPFDDGDCPPLNDWLRRLKKSPAVGPPGAETPLILESSRLYLYRYWHYQQRLAEQLRHRMQQLAMVPDTTKIEDRLRVLFPESPRDDTDWQKVAAMTALTKPFCVISGGPGTGKTHTVAAILSLLRTVAPTAKIALAAPTGKAAQRLTAALREARHREGISLPELTAATIHRLLRPVYDTPYFRHNADNPLPADILVVDEASMVDLALMAKLTDALKPDARLILLGDKDQLASVEAGAVLGDICDSDDADCFVHLKKSYRFGEESGIRQISQAINRGDAEAVYTLLENRSFDDTALKPLPPPHELVDALRPEILSGYGAYLKHLDDPGAAHAAFEKFRVLCALREGPYGVKALNRMIESILAATGKIRPQKPWYPGRPVMVSENHYRLRLFNGDVGLTLPDPDAGGEPRVFFPDGEGGFRRLSPIRMPAHDTVFAMTVHKSQGSEFDRILLMLPDRDAPVLTRELLYTGLTRAVRHAALRATPAILKTAVSRRTRRTSGLREAIRGDA